jgi:hypothetical protein
MSVAVGLERLRAEIERFEIGPYLLTVADDDRPHCNAVDLSWIGDELVMPAGNRTLANARARPAVSLLWPPSAPGGYSLIVDATVVAADGTGQGDNSITARPTRAVLHRPAAGSERPSAGCGSDCSPVLDTKARP